MKPVYKRLLIALAILLILALVVGGIILWSINDAFKNWQH